MSDRTLGAENGLSRVILAVALVLVCGSAQAQSLNAVPDGGGGFIVPRRGSPPLDNGVSDGAGGLLIPQRRASHIYDTPPIIGVPQAPPSRLRLMVIPEQQQQPVRAVPGGLRPILPPYDWTPIRRWLVVCSIMSLLIRVRVDQQVAAVQFRDQVQAWMYRLNLDPNRLGAWVMTPLTSGNRLNHDDHTRNVRFGGFGGVCQRGEG
ncbi:hypothetical protein [Siccirubricoccus deserti]|uniref:Uncharacterized protein n=1 Tax=Siccirubricoccus deserti TaxID=2013562 RepID=A0A9X0UGN7_9PROT|nr:hypothetical protein [Siccirubricoccus deserti]MBC4019153.1 hypothetical protein [Siccirubricoccus deserti]